METRRSTKHLVKDDKDQMLLDYSPVLHFEYLEYREKQSKFKKKMKQRQRIL
jgi:hypothetical protein